MLNTDQKYIRPIVSIIVTTFNRRDNLEKALVSILNQSFTDFEVIVVDNFSNYDIKKFIKNFNDDRLILIQNANHGNYVINRNLGIKKSRGDFIAFCDDDDYWLPDKLSWQMEIFQKSSDINLGLVYSKCYIMGAAGIYRIGPRTTLYNGNVFYKMLLLPSVPILTALVKRDVFRKIGYFNEDEAVLCQEDNEFWIRLSKYYSVKSISVPTAVYCEHENNLSNSNKISIAARLYLQKHMIKEGVITRLEWVFIVIPGVSILEIMKYFAATFRRLTSSLLLKNQ